MSLTRRQLALLAVLVLVAAVGLIVGIGNRPAGTPATPSNPAGRTGAASGEVETDVKLELLETDRDSLTEAARNPFRFEAAAPPPAPPQPPREDGPVVLTPPPPPAGPPPPPPIPLRFIGLAAVPDGMPIAFFNDGRGNVFQGREGDIIEGRYKVLQVGTDSVELAYLDGRGRQTIRLSGQ